MVALFLHCRAGFENECAAEIQERAAELGIAGYCKAKPEAAYVVFHPHEAGAAARLHEALAFTSLIFARQWFLVLALAKDLPVTDRVSALLEHARAWGFDAGECFLETPDTNEGKELSALCRSLARPMRAALEREGLWHDGGAWRLHLCFLSGTAAYVGYARRANSAHWPMGIPRLKFPRGAPSRSTLKLEEAFLCFLTEEEREKFLRPGAYAVDLGAAPGGWTWQLVRRHMRVTAVDNGTLAPELLDSGLVEHRREDGFRFRPAAPVDWMVCDIVEQPMRVADLAARWLAESWCAHAVFNLKLPMKKRYQEVQHCLARVHETLEAKGIPHTLACKQLYHDREEVTVYVRRK